MVYHLYDDFFGFEFVDRSFLEDDNLAIRNIDMCGKKKEALYKVPMGLIFKFKDGVFCYEGHVMLQWLGRQAISNKLKYSYITSDRYNKRIGIGNPKLDYDYMFERTYYLEGDTYQYLYKYFLVLEDANRYISQEKVIYIRDSMDLNFHKFDLEYEIVQYLQERKKELDKLFKLKNNVEIQFKWIKGSTESDTRSNKEKFMHTFFAQIVEYFFLEQMVGWNISKREYIDINILIPDTAMIEKKIEAEDEESIKKILSGEGEIQKFQGEYAILKYIIEKNRDENGKINFKPILEYVLTKVERLAMQTVEIGEKQAVWEMIEAIEMLPEKYFVGRKTIVIDCDEQGIDKKVLNLLEKYDYYCKVRHDEGQINSISSMIKIDIPKMSEGQRILLDLVSKSITAIYDANVGDTVVLLIDEPDRALHPELARKFLNILLQNINQCEDRIVQLVLASHSPFIVTDILPENVYAIDMIGGRRTIKNNENTFATNIYYLLMDSFMLDNTFGEYSYQKLKEIIDTLSREDEIDQHQLKKFEQIIDRVGEKTVKKKLQYLINRKREKQKDALITRILEEKDEEILQRIRGILEADDKDINYGRKKESD